MLHRFFLFCQQPAETGVSLGDDHNTFR
jgi:hypothetical protein